MPLRNLKRFLAKLFKQPFYAFRVALRRARAALSYRIGEGRSSLPESVTLFLTYRCNLRCKMCGQWGEGGFTKTMQKESMAEGLSFDEMKVLIDDLSSFKPN